MSDGFMAIYSNREKFRSLSLFAGKVFSRIPIPPNAWTILSLLFALAGSYAIFTGNVIAGVFIFAFSSFIDVIDGAVARATGRATNFGAYLDTVVDKYIEFMLVFSLLFLELPGFIMPSHYWIIILAFGSLMTSFAKSASAEKNVVSHQKGHGALGGLDHPDRAIIIIFAILLSVFSQKIYSTYVIAAAAILTNLSAVQRVRNAWRIRSKK